MIGIECVQQQWMNAVNAVSHQNRFCFLLPTNFAPNLTHFFFALRFRPRRSGSPNINFNHFYLFDLLQTNVIHIWTLRNLNANCRRTRTAERKWPKTFQYFFSSFSLFWFICSFAALLPLVDVTFSFDFYYTSHATAIDQFFFPIFALLLHIYFYFYFTVTYTLQANH